MNLNPCSIIHNSILGGICTLFWALFLVPSGNAEAFSSGPQAENRAFVLTELFDDIKYVLYEPDFYSVVGAIAVSPGLFRSSFESEAPEFTEMWATESADRFFESGEVIGGGAFQMAPSLICYSIGKFGNYSRMETLGSHLLRAHALNGLLTLGLKMVVKRTRPDGSPYGYPSGHSSSAFTSAGVIYNDLGPKWGIPAFVLASYVGLSRLQENKHYLSDVIAGAILGTYVSFKITHRDETDDKFAIKPAIIDGSPGARISLRF